MALQIPSSIKGVPVVTDALVKHAHERGLHVHVWTIDDPAEMTRLLELGVDGLMTDRPSVLKSLLILKTLYLQTQESLSNFALAFNQPHSLLFLSFKQ
jgi:hypothetical protein